MKVFRGFFFLHRRRLAAVPQDLGQNTPQRHKGLGLMENGPEALRPPARSGPGSLSGKLEGYPNVQEPNGWKDAFRPSNVPHELYATHSEGEVE